MDIAQEFEVKVLEHQKLMNDVIDLGNSPVQQFYRGATVFLTGGSGFMGKQLIEKLLRSCAVKKLYLLLRTKKGKTSEERLQFIFKDPVFDKLYVQQPQFTTKIEAVQGNVADIRLGINDEDWKMLTQEVDVIFHMAATIRFDEPLRVATLTNIRGTREVLLLARQCPLLKSYVHVSTAFTSATKENIGKDIYEQFNPTPVAPGTLISLVEELDDTRLNGITNKFIDGWPNTYTFTKTVAEELIKISAKDLPVSIVRPPIVLPTYYEPSPGWLDMSALGGISGVIVAVLLGILHVMRANVHTRLACSPLDYVNNAVIAAGWDAKQRRDTGDPDIPIYTVSNKDIFLNINFVANVMRDNVRYSTDKSVYMCGMFICKSKQLYWLLYLLLHYIPAYIVDMACAITKKKPAGIKSFVSIYKKMDKMIQLYEYFAWNYWNFRDDNIKAMLKRMSEADRAMYNCDVCTVNFVEFIVVWMIGIRKYIIKDGLNNSKLAMQKQRIFIVVNYVLLSLYAYVLFYICFFGINLFKYVFMFLI